MWWHGSHFLLAFGGLHPQPPAETPTFWAPQAVLLQINSNLGWTPKNASGVARSISHFVTQERSTSVVQKQAFRCNISTEGWGGCERRRKRWRDAVGQSAVCTKSSCGLSSWITAISSMRSVLSGYLLKCFFSSHSSDISVVFVRKQLQMKLLAWLLLARLAWLVLLRQLFKNYREIFTLQEGAKCVTENFSWWKRWCLVSCVRVAPSTFRWVTQKAPEAAWTGLLSPNQVSDSLAL